MNVRLTVRGDLVHEFDLLVPMHPMPDVICWGSRFFARRPDDVDASEYSEVFCYFVPPPIRPDNQR